MAFLSLLFFHFLIFLDWHGVFGQVLQNTTLDDSDPTMRYTGDWRKSAFNELDEGGEHMLTGDPNAQAIFEFTGVAVYFLSPLWPYDVTTQVQLDSRPPEILNLRDFDSPKMQGGWETVGSHIVWAAEGLEDESHVLRIAVGAGQVWAIVDGFIVTSVSRSVLASQSPNGPLLAPTITIHETATATASPHSSTPSSRSGGLNILAVGLGGGIAFLVLVIVALICSLFRRRRGPRGQLKVDLEKDFPSIPKPPRGFPNPSLITSSTTSSPTTPQSPPAIHSSQERQHTTLAFTPRQPRSTLENAVATDARRTTLERPPPGYYESVSAYRRSHRWTARTTRSVPPNQDPPPLPLYDPASGSHIPFNRHVPTIRNKH